MLKKRKNTHQNFTDPKDDILNCLFCLTNRQNPPKYPIYYDTKHRKLVGL